MTESSSSISNTMVCNSWFYHCIIMSCQYWYAGVELEVRALIRKSPYTGSDWWVVAVVAKFPCAIVTIVSLRLGSLDREGWGVSVLSHSRNWLEITTTTNLPLSKNKSQSSRTQTARLGSCLGESFYHKSYFIISYLDKKHCDKRIY